MENGIVRQWILKSRPEGRFKNSDFELREIALPDLGPEQVLLRNLYLSFDPTQRGWAARDTYMPAVPLGGPMRATGIGQVITSTSKRFKPGQLVAGLVNWQEYAHIDLRESALVKWSPLPAFLDLERTLALMVTGLTAYFGVLDIGKPRAGETMVVSGAAGATGSIAAQIAKLKGARVIGIAGGETKCRFLRERLGLDAAIDYKNEDVGARLTELCPAGINVYFDNVGGETLEAVLARLARGARIVLCGAISQYDKLVPEGMEPPNTVYGIKGTFNLIAARALMRGFLVTDYFPRMLEGLVLLNRWCDEGRLIQEVDCQQGFENVPQTLIRLFEGKNIGKQILRLTDPPLPLRSGLAEKIGFKLASAYFSLRG